MKQGFAIVSAFCTMVSVLICACDGILDGIYDEASDDENVNIFGTGVLSVDASEYDRWMYINFHTLTLDSMTIDLDLDDPLAEEPTDWDIAVHRYDARTNGGAAMETVYTSLEMLLQDGDMPEGDFVEDQADSVYVDMSQVMSGVLGYLYCTVNRELSKWMEVDLTVLPPAYTLSGRVYLVRFSDETLCALKLSNYKDDNGNTCRLTIDYVYPYEPEE